MPDREASARAATRMSRQLSFDLPPQVRLGPGDFFVSDANRAAFALVTGSRPWPEGKLALVGPAGAGKSHLGRVWAAAVGAETVAASDLSAEMRPGRALLVEDLQHLPQTAEEPLLHLHNHLVRTGGRLLLTADRPPSTWPARLPDLASRMQATLVATIGDPDDRLLAALLAKLFADRQVVPQPAVIPWLVSRIERSHAAAAEVVARLDAAALGRGSGVVLSLARAVLDNDPQGDR